MTKPLSLWWALLLAAVIGFGGLVAFFWIAGRAWGQDWTWKWGDEPVQVQIRHLASDAEAQRRSLVYVGTQLDSLRARVQTLEARHEALILALEGQTAILTVQLDAYRALLKRIERLERPTVVPDPGGAMRKSEASPQRRYVFVMCKATGWEWVKVYAGQPDPCPSLDHLPTILDWEEEALGDATAKGLRP